MIIEKKTSLRPIIESSDGVHLTAYLVNRGDSIDLKNQLLETIHLSNEWLNSVMSVEERNKFLEPLDSILKDPRIFKKIKGNIGLFRNEESFRILNIPIEVEQVCHVATSFHVKPLLKWLQVDQEFLILGFEKNSAHLYLGSQTSLKRIDSYFFSTAISESEPDFSYPDQTDPQLIKIKESETFSWLNDWISQLTKNAKPKLFLAGEKSIVNKANRKLKYNNVVRSPVASTFGNHNVSEICCIVRKIMKTLAKESVQKSQFEFRLADEDNRVQKNLFQISKAVAKSKVRKILVSDEINIFGKIDKKSGGLAVHPFDLDHEDDDILDDLAQMVLSQGGEVIVASKSDIPKGRPILAILDDDGKELENTVDVRLKEYLQERSG